MTRLCITCITMAFYFFDEQDDRIAFGQSKHHSEFTDSQT